MPARTTRQEARERILKSFMDSLDRIIPPESSVPLRGKTYLDWVLPTLLQERAALDDTAQVEPSQLGRCPRCGSDRVYLDHGGKENQKEVISPHGPVVLCKQQCRCRSCGRSFSPSGS